MKWNTRKLALSGLALFSFAFSTQHLFAAEKAVLTARAQATTQVGFDVYLPLQHRDQLEQLLSQMHDVSSSQYHKWLTPQQFHARFDMDASSVSAIKQQLSNLGLTVTQPSSHRLHIIGDAGTVERALGTTLKTGKFANGKQVVAATGSLTTPSALTQANAVVSGLSSMVRMRTHSFRSAKNTPDNRYGPTGAYWFTDLKQAYSFPSYKAYTGKGATIGILMAGDYNPPDMDLYFGHEKLATPKISTVNINGGAPPLTADAFETHLDIQQSGEPDLRFTGVELAGTGPGRKLRPWAGCARTSRAVRLGSPSMDQRVRGTLPKWAPYCSQKKPANRFCRLR